MNINLLSSLSDLTIVLPAIFVMVFYLILFFRGNKLERLKKYGIKTPATITNLRYDSSPSLTYNGNNYVQCEMTLDLGAYGTTVIKEQILQNHDLKVGSRLNVIVNSKNYREVALEDALKRYELLQEQEHNRQDY